jgi:hypothetical protein
MFNRSLIVVVVAAVAVLAAAAPSSATKPRGGCPPAFEERTFAQLLAFAQETGVPGTPEDHLAFLMRFDKNEDQRLCVLTVADPPGLPPSSINIIDNTANVPA